MAIPISFVPVPFVEQSANAEGKVDFVSDPINVITTIKVVGVNVKTAAPCDDNIHRARITVTSSDFESSLLFQKGVNLVNLPAFELENLNESGCATIRYDDDCHNCVRPFDLGCENPRLPVKLMNEAGDEPQSVTGSLFRVRLEIDGYERGAVVNAAVALCYEPPDEPEEQPDEPEEQPGEPEEEPDG
jgi:hypothetical protein